MKSGPLNIFVSGRQCGKSIYMNEITQQHCQPQQPSEPRDLAYLEPGYFVDPRDPETGEVPF